MDSKNNLLTPIKNPFNAPVYHEDTVDSTMNVSRFLASRGEPHGTVIVADFQEAGRGRINGRSWVTEKGSALLFTILLRYPRIEDIPTVLTLRTGLAVSLAIEDFLNNNSPLPILIKWPNDILISGKKVCGILTEAGDGLVPPAVHVHIGIGVNVGQKEFPDFLLDKASSICFAANREIADGDAYLLLEKILIRLHAEIAADGTGWRSRIEERLYKKGEPVQFIEGAADSGKTVSGILSGIGPEGELLITVGHEIGSFTAGELVF